MTTNHYECELCHGSNSANQFQCHFCGIVPARYSFLRVPVRIVEYDTHTAFIPAVVARGCERQGRSKASRVYFRTVPADYYAY